MMICSGEMTNVPPPPDLRRALPQRIAHHAGTGQGRIDHHRFIASIGRLDRLVVGSTDVAPDIAPFGNVVRIRQIAGADADARALG